MLFVDALVDQEETKVPCKANKQFLVQLDTWFNSRLIGLRWYKFRMTLQPSKKSLVAHTKPTFQGTGTDRDEKKERFG